MTAVESEGVVVRDLGPEYGRVEFVDGEGRKRAYYLFSPGNPKRKRLVSVTTVLGCLEKRALYAWHEARGAEGAFRAIAQGELSLESPPEDAVFMVRALGLGADSAKKKAADRGLDVHGALEVWAQTGDLPPAGELKIEARPYLKGLAMWLIAADPVPVAVEQIVAHPELAYGGRYDLLATIDGRLTLIDLKTSKHGTPYAEAHTQLRAYWEAEFAVGQEGIEEAVAVGVSPDGMFEAEPCCAHPRAFEHVLAVYRDRLTLDREIRGMRKEAV